MTPRTARNLAIAGAAVMLALIISRCDRVEVTEWEEATGEAASNPFYAASLLFEERGLEVERPVGWYDLPPDDFTLMLLIPRYSTTTDRADRLLAWVEDGGHLVIAPDSAYDRRWDRLASGELPEGDSESADSTDDSTFDSKDDLDLDFDQGSDPLEADEADVSHLHSDPILDALGVEVLLEPDLLTGEGTRIVNIDTGRGRQRVDVWVTPTLAHRRASTELELASGTFAAEGGHALLRFRRGQGAVTVIQDPSVLDNDQIALLDHARYAFDLAEPKSLPRRGVWLVHRDRFPSVFDLLRQHAAHAVLAGTVLLVAWLWHRGGRFGPIEGGPPPTRRRLLEHVRAVGHLLWRTKQQGALVDATRAAFERTAARRDPVLGPKSENERITRIAERIDMKPARLAGAVRADGKSTDFLALISTLEEARRRLAAHTLGGAAPTTSETASLRSLERPTENIR